MDIQVVPRRQYSVVPLERPIGENCMGKKSPFIVKFLRNTTKHIVVRNSVLVLNLALHILTTGLWKIKK